MKFLQLAAAALIVAAIQAFNAHALDIETALIVAVPMAYAGCAAIVQRARTRKD